jgi:hypothetical protein
MHMGSPKTTLFSEEKYVAAFGWQKKDCADGSDTLIISAGKAERGIRRESKELARGRKTEKDRAEAESSEVMAVGQIPEVWLNLDSHGRCGHSTRQG